VAKEPKKPAAFVEEDVLEAARSVREADADLEAAKKKTVDARTALDQATQEEDAAQGRASQAYSALLAAVTGIAKR
jgi:hypothetical protein